MMYVKNGQDVRRYIVEGSPRTVSSPEHGDAELHHEHATSAISMPAYGNVVSARELDELVVAVKVLAGMVAPDRNTPARAGRDLARRWNCFSCHGPAGSACRPIEI